MPPLAESTFYLTVDRSIRSTHHDHPRSTNIFERRLACIGLARPDCLQLLRWMQAYTAPLLATDVEAQDATQDGSAGQVCWPLPRLPMSVKCMALCRVRGYAELL